VSAVTEPSLYLLERAVLPDGVADDVLVAIAGGRFTRVVPRHRGLLGDAVRPAGLTRPGLANCHNHAFHRALRGRTQAERGTFWTWREQMYTVAAKLEPDIALSVREMGLSPAQALWAATAGGARALSRTDVGVLKPGNRADLAVLDAPSFVHLAYRPGVPLVVQTWRGGRPDV
jgi:cytosine/adenosine deaminase-related metal-dependent hydrolase